MTALLFAGVMLLALTACGGQKAEAPAEEPGLEETVENTAEQETVESTAEDDAAAVETEDDAEADEGPQLGQQPADPTTKPETGSRPADTTQKAEGTKLPVTSQTPAQETVVVAPAEAAQETASVDLTAFYEQLTGSGEWPSMMQLEGESLDAFYPGLSDIATKQCGVYVAMISAAVGEVALVEVRDTADVSAVKRIFQARIDDQVGDEENPGAAWYPETIEGWQKNARIAANGNYVMLVVRDGADSDVAAFNALFA
jgi:hypothetical protein